MQRVLLITGSSSGIGEATVRHFLDQGWFVVATMRQPERSPFASHPHLKVHALDVTDACSIQQLIQQWPYPRLDAVVNNAGYGLIGPLVTTPRAAILQQFDTNVFGLIDIMQAVIHKWQGEQYKGVLVNVASIGGRTTFPLYSVYHASKWAVEGLSESAAYELASTGIRVKIIEPGPIKTAFYGRSRHVSDLGVYTRYATPLLKAMDALGQNAPGPELVASTIWQAVTDNSHRLRYPVNTKGSLWLRRLLPEGLYRKIMPGMLQKMSGV